MEITLEKFAEQIAELESANNLLREENARLLGTLKSIAGIETWIPDRAVKTHFQKKVYGAIAESEK